MSYYWPKMVQDSMDYAKKCDACQYHANIIHQPLEPLHPIVTSWSFEVWGLDLVDPITPYSLVYGVDVVLPLQREIPSLRMAVQEGWTTENNVKLRLQELEALDEKRLEAQQTLECYQSRMSKAFDKHVKPRSFQVGDLVLVVRRSIIITRNTENKFTPKWDGPYIVKEVYTNGAYKIVDRGGLKIGPINGKFLKKFYA
ncbi:uncharacterized protein E6C27_scaffold34G002410 [Cucumis melo var. makuwa]|uniref:Integrase zinc-binding domain-containing protein n=1 Tax=Cucumis melo var. makuwa TaxID=1194695 RepID=A0A5A7SMJ2_CUCMM|nr:uncharacterized protein E6C27_scaffold34G002410 [Cucumis melo var. makuwa]